ncbi:MAG: hypothetical protein KF704_01800 [Crocinitomicaceae bacterium]|nr:hypothetical protein [Crocinitomicaceae bacterium]
MAHEGSSQKTENAIEYKPTETIVKKEKKYIDELFNEALNNRSFDIPEAFMDDLNNRLDAIEKKKRRGFLWWFILFAGFTVIFFSLALLTQRTEKPQPIITDFNNGSTTTKQEHETLSITRQRRTEHTVPRAGNQTNTLTGMNTGIKSNSLQSDEHNNKTNNKKADTTIKAAYGTITSFSGHRTKDIPETIITEKKIQNNDSVTIYAGNPVTTDHSTSEQLDPDIHVESGDHILKNIPDEGVPDPVSAHIVNDSTGSTIAHNTLNQLLPTDKNEKTTGNWKKEMQLYGGIGTTFYNDRSDTSNYLKQFKEIQRRIIIPDIGINGHFSYKNMTFGAGLNYNQTGEKYTSTINHKFFRDSTIHFTSYDTIYYYDSINGTWEIQEIVEVPEQYTFQFQDSTLIAVHVKNSYSWVSVPLYFGYRFQAGSFEFIPRLGVQFNFGVARRVGNYPDFLSQSITQFKAKAFSLSYVIQLEIRRNFQNHWHVFVNPYFKSAFTPTISLSMLNRKYSSLGIQLGIGYTFRK